MGRLAALAAAALLVLAVGLRWLRGRRERGDRWGFTGQVPVPLPGGAAGAVVVMGLAVRRCLRHGSSWTRRRRRPAPAYPGRCWRQSAGWRATAGSRRHPVCTAAPTSQGPRARCSSSRPPLPRTPPWGPGGESAVAVRPGRRRLHGGRAAVRQRGRHERLGCPMRSADYNHSTVYVNEVLVLAHALQANPALRRVAGGHAPWRSPPRSWGCPTCGAAPASAAIDCSGLVQAAYRSAGVALPRVAQTPVRRRAAGARRRADRAGRPGVLRDVAHRVEHVGIYVGAGEMIDAPTPGAVVRVDAVH